jgi:hypothetical protein
MKPYIYHQDYNLRSLNNISPFFNMRQAALALLGRGRGRWRSHVSELALCFEDEADFKYFRTCWEAITSVRQDGGCTDAVKSIGREAAQKYSRSGQQAHARIRKWDTLINRIYVHTITADTIEEEEQKLDALMASSEDPVFGSLDLSDLISEAAVNRV